MDQYFVEGTEQMYDKTIIFRIPVKEVKDSGFVLKMSRMFWWLCLPCGIRTFKGIPDN